MQWVWIDFCELSHRNFRLQRVLTAKSYANRFLWWKRIVFLCFFKPKRKNLWMSDFGCLWAFAKNRTVSGTTLTSIAFNHTGCKRFLSIKFRQTSYFLRFRFWHSPCVFEEPNVRVFVVWKGWAVIYRHGMSKVEVWMGMWPWVSTGSLDMGKPYVGGNLLRLDKSA